MTIDEAKEILLSTPLKSNVREALNVLISDLMSYYDLPGEQWRNFTGDAVEFTADYQVSNFGRIKSFKCRKVTILKSHEFGGYLCVELKKGDTEKNFKVHRLVAQAFISNVEGKPFVNHIDGVKTNNCADNLEWVTHSENCQHAYDTGLRVSGYKRDDALLTAEQVREIRRNCIPCNRKCGFTAFAKKFNVNANTVRLAYHRKIYKNVD